MITFLVVFYLVHDILVTECGRIVSSSPVLLIKRNLYLRNNPFLALGQDKWRREQGA